MYVQRLCSVPQISDLKRGFHTIQAILRLQPNALVHLHPQGREAIEMSCHIRFQNHLHDLCPCRFQVRLLKLVKEVVTLVL
jgi:hypothetical protein